MNLRILHTTRTRRATPLHSRTRTPLHTAPLCLPLKRAFALTTPLATLLRHAATRHNAGSLPQYFLRLTDRRCWCRWVVPANYGATGYRLPRLRGCVQRRLRAHPPNNRRSLPTYSSAFDLARVTPFLRPSLTTRSVLACRAAPLPAIAALPAARMRAEPRRRLAQPAYYAELPVLSCRYLLPCLHSLPSLRFLHTATSPALLLVTLPTNAIYRVRVPLPACSCV